MDLKNIAVLALLALAAPALRQDAAVQPFRVQVDAVRVDALVTRRGQPVAGLTADEFEILDNGVEQRIEDLTVETVPVSVLLALDVSESMVGNRLALVRDAARVAVETLRPTDRVSILEFSHAITLRVSLTTDRARLFDGLNALSAGGNTALYDAVYTSLLLGATDGSRNLLLVFTDGNDTASWLRASAVQDAAMRSEFVVYAVAAQSQIDRPVDMLMRSPNRRWRPGELTRRPVSDEFLARITAATGGRVLQAKHDDLAQKFSSVVREFHNRYLLTYFPRGVETRGWHEITLRVKRRGADVQARRGYWR